MTTFGGATTSIVRFPVVTNAVSGARTAIIDLFCYSGVSANCSLPLQAAIDLVFGPQGELYVADFVARKVFQIRPKQTGSISAP